MPQMEKWMKRLTLVVAAALIDPAGRLLINQRPADKAMAGYWELPGGKIEPGESPEAGLQRELQEELGVRIDIAHLVPLGFASHAYPEFHLLMPVFSARRWTGQVLAREGQRLEWVGADNLADRNWVAADLPLLPMLAGVMTIGGEA